MAQFRLLDSTLTSLQNGVADVVTPWLPRPIRGAVVSKLRRRAGPGSADDAPDDAPAPDAGRAGTDRRPLRRRMGQAVDAGVRGANDMAHKITGSGKASPDASEAGVSAFCRSPRAALGGAPHHCPAVPGTLFPLFKSVKWWLPAADGCGSLWGTSLRPSRFVGWSCALWFFL